MPAPAILVASRPPSDRPDIGSLVRLRCTFEDVAGELIDPSEVRFIYRRSIREAATEFVYGTDDEIVQADDDIGKYHVDIDFDLSGQWFWRWEAGGDYQGAVELSVIVKETAFE